MLLPVPGTLTVVSTGGTGSGSSKSSPCLLSPIWGCVIAWPSALSEFGDGTALWCFGDCRQLESSCYGFVIAVCAAKGAPCC